MGAYRYVRTQIDAKPVVPLTGHPRSDVDAGRVEQRAAQLGRPHVWQWSATGLT